MTCAQRGSPGTGGGARRGGGCAGADGVGGGCGGAGRGGPGGGRATPPGRPSPRPGREARGRTPVTPAVRVRPRPPPGPGRRQTRVVQAQLVRAQRGGVGRVALQGAGLPPIPVTTPKLAARTPPRPANGRRTASRTASDPVQGSTTPSATARTWSGSTPTLAPVRYGTGSACNSTWKPGGPPPVQPRRPPPAPYGPPGRARRGWRPPAPARAASRCRRGRTPGSRRRTRPVPGPGVRRRKAPPGRRPLSVPLAAHRAEAQRHQVLRPVAEADARDLVVGVEVGEAVPAAGLQFGAVRAGPGGGLRREVHEVVAHGGAGDAGGPGVAVAVGVDHRGVRVFRAEPRAVREDHPAVHLQARGGQRLGGLPVRIVAGRPALAVRGEGPARPAVRVRRVEDGGVLGGHDAVGGVAGVRARVEW